VLDGNYSFESIDTSQTKSRADGTEVHLVSAISSDSQIMYLNLENAYFMPKLQI